MWKHNGINLNSCSINFSLFLLGSHIKHAEDGETTFSALRPFSSGLKILMLCGDETVKSILIQAKCIRII